MDKFVDFMKNYGWIVYSIIGVLNLICTVIMSICYMTI